ncbi:uncharacterized protein LOC133391915 [Anopheles gambiae]|uniref:uncharacterized protein LOC133391915 n=1 Tax=Anopheles gambiae TaxID=7165 RepID=UPI002AC96B30|nr:uncharacterized protein LOC133391915 [Anopheles gambiae]XP_061504657.1 uncharacterized protein LOC133391915 [Anopheles gambiae]XP_061504668.1 uncharacterized protein LOC133391915 [Anopheles gambiae]XP_061504677.1 uncharacterized protein LOC133391915 [Anopheles gambiae]XP_061504678.1 uncharacterized protein LOC133391915 [Anopheles gambiae]
MQCSTCNALTDSANSVSCAGVCGSKHHTHCTGFSRDSTRELGRNNQLLWLCKTCHEFRIGTNSLLTSEIAALLELVKADILTTIDSSLSSLRSAIKSDLLPEILALVDKRAPTPILAKPSVSNASRSHTSTNVSSLNATNTSRTIKTASTRRTFTNSTELTDDIQAANDTNTVDDSDNCNHYNHRTKPTSDVSAGNYRTNTQASSDPVLNQNTTNTGIAEKVWLYFTNIKSHVSADDMRVWLKAVLPTDDINVYRLTKKGVNLDSMSFISFKVSVPKSLKELALQSTIWPVSLTVREFVARGLPKQRVHERARFDPSELISHRTNSENCSSAVPKTTAHPDHFL